MNDLLTIPITSLRLSATKAQAERRAHFDQSAIAELAESLKTVGLLQPLVVRPAPPQIVALDDQGAVYETEVGACEIIAGERRFLAAQLAGLTEIPCSVRELTDEQVLEVQLVENLQRADLHELAEAEGYEALQQLGHSVEEIAAKVGKSKATVYARCKLLALGPEAREVFRKRELSASIALLIARIPAEHQAATLAKIMRGWGDGPMSYRDAASFINRDFNMRLDEAEFPTEDPMLVKAAGSCLMCPKRSGNQPELFPDIERGDVCTDKACFDAKAAAWVQVKITAARRHGRAVEGDALKAIAPHGLARGGLKPGYIDLDWACHEDSKSRTYRELLGDAAEKALVLVDADAGEVAEVVQRKDVEKILKSAIVKRPAPKYTDHLAEQSKREVDHKAERMQKLQQRIFKAIFDASPSVLREAANFAAADAMQAFGRMQEICEALGWHEFNMDHAEREIAKLSNNDVARLLRVLPLSEEIDTYSSEPSRRLLEAAKSLKIDVKKIEQQLDAELAPKTSPAPAAKKKPAKKAARKAK